MRPSPRQCRLHPAPEALGSLMATLAVRRTIGVKADQHDATSVQFTALPEIDETQRLLQRLDLQGKSPHEFEAKVLAIARSAPDSSSTAPLLAHPPAP